MINKYRSNTASTDRRIDLPNSGDCGEAMATDLGFHYDYFAPSAGTLFALDVLIQFKTKRVLTKNEIEYSGPFTMASYDNLAVYADHIRINTGRLELWADGSIVYEDGATRRRAEHVHIDINLASFWPSTMVS